MTNEIKTELHPLEPFFPEGARMLMLGSFPPAANRWKMNFYYPNFQNDMWRIFGCVFFDDKDYFLTEDRKSFCEVRIRQFLEEKRIADVKGILEQLPDCQAVVTTGQKATDTLLMLLQAEEPRVGQFSVYNMGNRQLRIYRMPSSSRAYPKPLTEKAEIYKNMFRELGML